MVYTSIHKFARISPTKVRRIAIKMKGLRYEEAMAYLKYMPHAGAKIIYNVAHTSAANALVKNQQLDESSLFVDSVIVDEGPRMKRIWRRARGRADVLLKRFSHVRVNLTDDKKVLMKNKKNKKRS